MIGRVARCACWRHRQAARAGAGTRPFVSGWVENVVRARDLGIVIGQGRHGRLNAITDVKGVRVGHTTLVRGEGRLVVGQGPVRTGVTVVVPHEGAIWTEPVFAGGHVLNGNGELTGMSWVADSGLLTGPIAITNTHSVGVVRDALVAHAARAHDPEASFWSLPVVGETYDGTLNDINGFHVRPDHLDAALAGASDGPVAEGNVGGGTGNVCHEFKGGIGTASRVVAGEPQWVVGVLVQANYGSRRLLTIAGVPVGRAITTTVVPTPFDDNPAAGAGSIIIVVATDAPLLPHQCTRLAQRAGLGLARSGGYGATSSGDLFVCFATGNRGMPTTEIETESPIVRDLRAVIDQALDPLFEATIEATEEAIANALVAAETMVGRDGATAYALPHDLLVEAMTRHGHLTATG
jgi:D-aminopeptidase